MSEDLKPIAQDQELVQEQSATVSEQVVAEVNDEMSIETLTENESEESATEIEVEDYSNKGLKEIVDIFQKLLESGNAQLLYKHAEGIKAAFYKTLKREKIAAGFIEPEHSQVEAGAENQEEAQSVSVNPFAEIERGFKELYNRYRGIRAEFLRNQEKNKEENLEKKLAVIEELKNLLESQEDLNRTYPEFRNIQNKWRSVGPVPQGRVKDVYETYQHYVEAFYDYVKINKEMRDYDFKKNLEAKTKLCEKAEALASQENVVAAFRALQKLHEEWKEFGPVDKENRESIWERFKAATSLINKKHQAYFESQKGNQKENLEAKTALCERLEAFLESDSTDSAVWNKYAQEVEVIQQEWKKIGFASKKENQKIYERYRAACDKFFAKKREFYNIFKAEMQANMEKKVALCERAEALGESTDWKKTSEELVELQKQWREIGPVSRKKSEQVWRRFRTACDVFFNNRDKHFGSNEVGYEDNLIAKQAIINELKEYQLSDDKNENISAMRDFQARWNEIGFVPFKEKNRIQEAFKHLMETKFEGLKGAMEGESRISRYNRRFADSANKAERSARSERDRLVQKFIKKEQDIATWENNMGFFSKSKNADALLEELNKKIEIAKAELAQLEEKIKEIDNKQQDQD